MDDMPVTHVSVTIDEYNRLIEVDNFMDALQAAGVDNWEGYDLAYQIYKGEIDEDDI